MSENEKKYETTKLWNDLSKKEWKGITYEGGFKIKYPEYDQREEMKDIAWKAVKESIKDKNFYRAAWFLLNGVITSHYWRAREDLERLNEHDYEFWMKKIRGKKYYKHYRIDIDHYTQHWLYANGDRSELFPKEVVDSTKEYFYYEPEFCKYLEKGYSLYWIPYEDRS